MVLVSGGLDSATTLALANEAGFETYALTFRYGQKHCAEIDAACAVVDSIGAHRHEILDIDAYRLGRVLLASDESVPKNRTAAEIESGIPGTYVPARNTIFLSHALAWAEMIGANDIFIGVTAVDYSGYPDCRPEYIEAFQAMARLATKRGVEGQALTVHAPLIQMCKEEIIRTGTGLGVDYGITSTCYDPDAEGNACGACDACLLRARGFMRAGVPDPTRYSTLDGRS